MLFKAGDYVKRKNTVLYIVAVLGDNIYEYYYVKHYKTKIGVFNWYVVDNNDSNWILLNTRMAKLLYDNNRL